MASKIALILILLSAVILAELELYEDEILRELSAAEDITSLNITNLSLQTERLRKPIKCKDNKGCKKWLKRRFCADRRFNAGTKALLCPVACGFCDFREKPFPTFQRNMNEKADPCRSFHEYTCGKLHRDFPSTDPIHPYGEMHEISRRLRSIQKGNILAASNSPAVQKMQLFYGKCLNGGEFSAEISAKIRAVSGCPMLMGSAWAPAGFDLTRNLAILSALMGTQPFIGLVSHKAIGSRVMAAAVEAPELLMRKAAYYSGGDSAQKIAALREFLNTVVGFVARDGGFGRADAEIQAAVEEIIRLDGKIAAIVAKHLGEGVLGNAKDDKRKYADLKRTITVIDWDRYVMENPLFSQQIGEHFAKNPDFYFVTEKLWAEVNTLLLATSNGTLANYLITKFIVEQSSEMDDKYQSALAKFIFQVDGMPPRGGRDYSCLQSVLKKLTVVSDHVFVKKSLTKKMIDKASDLVEDLRASLLGMIQKARWMDESTKPKAMEKIRRTKKIIAALPSVFEQSFVDKFYSDLDIGERNSYLSMNVRILTHRSKFLLESILLKPEEAIQRHLLYSNTVEMNAFNQIDTNYIMIKGGIMQPPFLDETLPTALLYGSLGAVIGHEFTHGIDPIGLPEIRKIQNSGAEFDIEGSRKTWWDSQTKQHFAQKAKCFVRLYGSQVEPQSGLRLLAAKSVGEDVSDHGGLRAAFAAYQRWLRRASERHLSGYRKFNSNQLFFLGFAMYFCTSRHAALQTYIVQRDVHSPDQFRTDLSLSNFPAFAKAFKCRRGTAMRPRRHCSVW